MELLERAAEMAALSEAVLAAAGGNGRFLAFEAQPGLGKTELLREAARLFADAGLTVATARGSQLEQEFAFGVVRQLFDRVLTDAGNQRSGLLAGAASKCAALLDPMTVPAGPESQGLFGRSRAAEALVRLGRPGEADRLVRRELKLARSFGAARPLGIALTSAALLAGGDEALPLAQQAVAVLDPSPARLELARAQEILGMVQTRQGGREPGRQAFRRALQLALECHAGALAERVRERLTSGGGRPPGLWLTGVHSLTPAERRVAQLVARELTNRQVAETLFVTEKTVEAHLNRVYRKLEVNSRWQLKNRLDEHAVGDALG